MPFHLHRSLIALFRNRPGLAAELLAGAPGGPVAAFADAGLVSGDLTDLTPTEYRADAVVMLYQAGSAVTAVVVEVQLRRDRDRRWIWPVYLATLRARYRCPVVLLVVCLDRRVADWCATPIDLGHPSWTLRPLVLGPDLIPMVTDAKQAIDDLELAILSMVAHVARPDWSKVADAVLTAFDTTKNEHAYSYHDIVIASLPAAARRTWEALMSTGTYRYHSEFARRHFSEGEAKAVLTVLEARGIAVPEEARARITQCTDPEQCDIWVRRAVTATSVDDLFDLG
jgi:hypothetical protein